MPRQRQGVEPRGRRHSISIDMMSTRAEFNLLTDCWQRPGSRITKNTRPDVPKSSKIRDCALRLQWQQNHIDGGADANTTRHDRDQKKTAYVIKTSPKKTNYGFWCERRDSNSHRLTPLEPKSSASTNSATFANIETNYTRIEYTLCRVCTHRSGLRPASSIQSDVTF
jgi:hypothetical protein